MYCTFVEECKKKGEEPMCEGNCVMWFDEETQNAIDDGAHRNRSGAGFVICSSFREFEPKTDNPVCKNCGEPESKHTRSNRPYSNTLWCSPEPSDIRQFEPKTEPKRKRK